MEIRQYSLLKPKIMKNLVLILALLAFAGCEKSDKTCNCNNPTEDLPWLKELKASLTDCTCKVSIFEATYKDQTVFYTLMNDPLCDGIWPVVLLDCDGNQLKTYPSADQDFTREVTNQSIVYSCKTDEK